MKLHYGVYLGLLIVKWRGVSRYVNALVRVNLSVVSGVYPILVNKRRSNCWLIMCIYEDSEICLFCLKVNVILDSSLIF